MKKKQFLALALSAVMAGGMLAGCGSSNGSSSSSKSDAKDEVVYTSTDLNVDKVYIDLTGEEKGKYTLEIQLPKEAFTGDFELE